MLPHPPNPTPTPDLPSQEAVVEPPWVAFAVRPQPGVWHYLRVNVESMEVHDLTVSEYLAFKETLVEPKSVSRFLICFLTCFLICT